MCVPFMENPTCSAYNEYEKVSEMVPLDFSEENVTWVASNLSGATEALGAEAVYMSNLILCFRYASEDFILVVADLSNWMATSSPPGMLAASLHWISVQGCSL